MVRGNSIGNCSNEDTLASLREGFRLPTGQFSRNFGDQRLKNNGFGGRNTKMKTNMSFFM